jgi:vancomycin permeability regulator SanA
MLVGAGVATAAFIAFDGLTDDPMPADVAVVPGNQVELDGRPSARLAARLDTAGDLYRRGVVKAVIVSGGTGVEGFDEADAMEAYLRERGVPAAAIFADHDGVNTLATGRNTAALLMRQGWRNALVVTQFFHVTRTRLSLQKYGVAVAGAVHAPFFELRDVYSLAREVIGLWAYVWPWREMLPLYLRD